MWKGGIAKLTPRDCRKCGTPCESSYAAWRHCQQPRAIPTPCQYCGKICRTYREARVCCRRPWGEHQWHNYETPERALARRAQEVRADPAAMAEIRLLAEWIADTMPE